MLNEFDRSLLTGFSEPVTFAALRASHHKIIPRVPGHPGGEFSMPAPGEFWVTVDDDWFRMRRAGRNDPDRTAAFVRDFPRTSACPLEHAPTAQGCPQAGPQYPFGPAPQGGAPPGPTTSGSA